MENHGFRFRPTHEECIAYLGFKVAGFPLPRGATIPDRNPYNPQELAGILMDAENNGELFFFTKLTTKGKTGTNNVNRTVGEGTWHGDTTKKVDHRGRNLGKYTKLSYQEKGSIYHRRLTMTEYTIVKNTKIRYDPFKNYVLCHLVKNEGWINGNKVTNSNRQSVSNEIADRVATVDTEELFSDQIYTEPTHDQQPLATEEDAGFRNFETLQDGRSLVQTDNGWANDPTATFTAISDHNSGNYYSCAFGNQLQVPLQTKTPAPMLNYPAAALITDKNAVNQSECEVGCELVPYQGSTPADESNYSMVDDELSHLLDCPEPPGMELEALSQPNYWPYYSLEIKTQQVSSQISDPSFQDDDSFVNFLMSIYYEIDIDWKNGEEEATEQRQPVISTSTTEPFSSNVCSIDNINSETDKDKRKV